MVPRRRLSHAQTRLHLNAHHGGQAGENLIGADAAGVIHHAASNDAETFAAVIAAAQSTWTAWAGDTFQPYDMHQLAVQWSNRLADPDTIAFVSRDDSGKAVAVAAASPEAASHEPSITDADSAHLSTLFAVPESHGSGIAQELHDHMLGALAVARYRTVRLWVPEGAARARHFYERNKWAVTGRLTTFAGLPRVEMRRPVS